MLHSKFQAAEPSSSGQEDFKVFFFFWTKTPCRRAVLDPGLPLNKLSIGPLGTKFQAIELSGSQEEDFSILFSVNQGPP